MLLSPESLFPSLCHFHICIPTHIPLPREEIPQSYFLSLNPFPSVSPSGEQETHKEASYLTHKISYPESADHSLVPDLPLSDHSHTDNTISHHKSSCVLYVPLGVSGSVSSCRLPDIQSHNGSYWSDKYTDRKNRANWNPIQIHMLRFLHRNKYLALPTLHPHQAPSNTTKYFRSHRRKWSSEVAPLKGYYPVHPTWSPRYSRHLFLLPASKVYIRLHCIYWFRCQNGKTPQTAPISPCCFPAHRPLLTHRFQMEQSRYWPHPQASLQM